MRVLYWTELFWPYIGGLEVFGTRLLTALRKRGHDFLVVTGHGPVELPDVDDYNGIPVHRFAFLETLAARNLLNVLEIRRRVVELKRAFSPDVVHVKMTSVAPTTLFHLESAGPPNAPMLVTLQGAVNPAAGQAETVHGRLLRRADWVTAVSSATLAGAHALVPEIAERSSVIYNCLDMSALSPSPHPRQYPTVLCVGRLTAEKGFDVAVAAFASIARAAPAARMIVAGDGPERGELERIVARLGLTARVQFLGWVAPERIPDLMNTASVVVVPSREEAFGIVALEAAAMARPVIATRVGGLPEVVEDRRTGLLVDSDDVEALGRSIARLLADPEAAAEMGRAARQRALRDFTLERAADAYLELYRCLSKEGTHVAVADPLPRQ
jgi:glycogen(starch) synthase